MTEHDLCTTSCAYMHILFPFLHECIQSIKYRNNSNLRSSLVPLPMVVAHLIIYQAPPPHKKMVLNFIYKYCQNHKEPPQIGFFTVYIHKYD